MCSGGHDYLTHRCWFAGVQTADAPGAGGGGGGGDERQRPQGGRVHSHITYSQ